MNEHLNKRRLQSMSSPPQRVIELIISSAKRSSSSKAEEEEEVIDHTSATIAVITCSMGSVLILRDPTNNAVPFLLSTIFKCHTLAFEALVICVMFSFSTSFAALFSSYSSRVKEARFFRSCSISCLVSALALLLYAVCSSSPA